MFRYFEKPGIVSGNPEQFLSRGLINHSLLPRLLSPPQNSGEKIMKDAVFAQGVESER